MRKNYFPAKFFLAILFIGSIISVSPILVPITLASITCQYTPRDSEGMVIGPGYLDYVEDPSPVAREWLLTVDSEEGCNIRCAGALRICGENRPDHCDPRRSICESRSDSTGVCTCCNEDIATSPMVKELCDDFCGRTPERKGVKTFGDESFSCPTAPTAPASTAPAPYQFESITPRLEIPLPTLPSLTNFMDVTLQGEAPNRYLLIPWLGQYIAAIYKYAIGIVGILSGIMIVVGGLIWLTAGGAADRVSTAKSFIESSLVGLVIALTSFLLLYAINPKLTEFDSLRVQFVERIDFVQGELLTTTVDTTGDGGRGGGGGGGGVVSGTVTGWQATCSDSYPDCPIILNEPCVAGSGAGPNNPRAKEFLEKIKETLGGGTARQKVLKIADAATKCGVVLGSCGKTVEQINGVAGISGKGPKREGIHSNNPLCAINCDSPGKTCRDLVDSLCGQAPGAPKRQKVFELIRGGNPGYPDDWTKLLEPGDAFDMYAVNSGVGGQHAVIFVGWEADGKKARVVEGASAKLVKYGSWCIKSTCPNPTPVTYVYNAGQ